MAEFSSIMAIEINEAGQPTNLVAFSQGDKISNEVLNDDIVNAATEVSAVSSTVFVNSGTWGTGGGGIDPYLLDDITEVSTGFKVFSGDIQTCAVFVSGVVDDLETSSRNLETSSRNLSGIVDQSFINLETSTRNLETSSRNLSSIVDQSFTDLEASTRNMSSIVDSSFIDLEASTRNFSSIVDSSFIDLETSTRNLSSIVDGSFIDLETSTRNMSGVVDGSFIDLETSTRNMSGIVDNLGIGSAVASAIAVGNGSSVIVSGADTPGTGIDAPADNMVLAIDTNAQRIKFRKVGRAMIADEAIDAGQLADGAVEAAKLDSGAAAANLATNSISFIQLPLMTAETFAGNSASIGGNMGQINMATAKTMLGLGAKITVGSTAPTSPNEGDLWYDTTTGVDELFAYDSGRGKWLSTCTRQYYFARNAAATTNHSHLGPGSLTYNQASRIGYLIPYDMTVVGYAWNQSTTAGEAFDWDHRIMRYDLATSSNGVSLTISPTGSYNNYVDMTLNTDYDGYGILGSNMNPGGSATSVQHQTVTIFMKRRTS